MPNFGDGYDFDLGLKLSRAKSEIDSELWTIGFEIDKLKPWRRYLSSSEKATWDSLHAREKELRAAKQEIEYRQQGNGRGD